MFHCPNCSRSFRSRGAQEMHSRAVHIDFPCPACNRRFRSDHALAQHFAAVHHAECEDDEEDSVDSWRPNPPVDSAGYWVPREEFTGKKSFGYFQCESCFKTWISAHAFPSFKQGCKKCDTEDYPIFLWENMNKKQHDDLNYQRDEKDKPHDQNRCEACRCGVGVCLR
jgi:uncharacterized C2H2 Zn-finger protein